MGGPDPKIEGGLGPACPPPHPYYPPAWMPNSVSNHFSPTMRRGSSRQFQWDPATYLSVSGTGDLILNFTQEKEPFTGTVFHALSSSVVYFLATVSFRNHRLTGLNSSIRSIYSNGFVKLTLINRITPCKIFLEVTLAFWKMWRTRCNLRGVHCNILGESVLMSKTLCCSRLALIIDSRAVW